MELVLVRHGETEYNRADMFRGRADLELNHSGIIQARAAAEYLSGLDFEAFYASPLLRSMHTAGEIADPHGGEVIPLDYFIDVDYGQWSGKKLGEVKARWPDEFALWADRPEEVIFPGGESLRGVRERLEEGLAFLAGRHGGRVLVVGHKVINRLTLCIVLGLPTAGIWRVEQSNGAISIINKGERGWMLVRMNDSSHLKGIASIDQET
ncbi:MAG: histidine phosphatase family protein [Actinomycetota bacterium]|nr:histidine phosphatase family protein [Actinomycetota bacterium]